MAAHPAQVRRGNHRWMLVVFATPLVIVAIAAGVSVLGPSAPSVAVTSPAGYRAISDAYFGYAVPSAWAENDSATTDTGDYYYQGSGGWAGEVLATRATPPTLGEAAPAALGLFGSTKSSAFRLVDGRATTVSGTAVAWSYQLVRNGVVTASVVDAWSSGSGEELWLAVHGDPATTATVLASLRG